jgi:sulfopropanediol 3-dehydrogenase
MPRQIKQAALAGQQDAADAKIRSTVESIIADVEKRGDTAVRELSERFDKWSPPSFRLSENEIAALVARVAPQTIDDIKFAQAQIRNFAEIQRASLRMSRLRHCPGSCSATGISRSAMSAAMCPAAAIRWWPRRI